MSKYIRWIGVLLACLFMGSTANAASVKPVVPNASPEAVALLNYLYEISGKYTLTGQHCIPLNGSTRLSGVHKQTGHYPAVFGQDFGFSEPGTWDGINYRQNIVDEAIRRHADGFIVTIMWHAVNPMHDEPVTFQDSIQSKLSDAEWKELTTPGTPLHERWKSQVDVIAFFLKQLRDAKVPVLWRPYHEMNGFWFWWGFRQGDEGYKKLYRMLYDRLTNFHKLNNLIWVFNANEIKPEQDVLGYDLYFPGHDVVDVLATDVYAKNFNQENYDAILALAGKKPIALGEVGKLPTLEKLKEQPRWVWFMGWRDPDNFFWHDQDALKPLFNDKRTLTLEELPWVDLKDPVIHYPLLR